MEAKGPLESKTIWVNGVALLAAVTGTFGLDLGLDAETQAALVGGIMAVVNVVLRFMTRTAIKVGGAK